MGLDFTKMPDQPDQPDQPTLASPILRDADPKRLNSALIHSEALGFEPGRAYEDSDLVDNELKKISLTFAPERDRQKREFGLESLKQYGAYVPWLGLSAFRGATSYFLENIFFFKEFGTDKAIAEAIEYWREKTGPEDIQLPDFGFEFKGGKLRLRPAVTPVKDILGATAEVVGAVAGPIGAAFKAGRLVVSKFAAEAGPFYQSIARGMATGALLGEGRKDQTLENMALFGVFEPIAFFLGRASEVPGRIRKTTAWRNMTVKERGLIIQELDEVNAKAAEYLEIMKGRGATSETLEFLAGASEGRILRDFNNPTWRNEALSKRTKLEKDRVRAETDEAIRAKAREEGRPEVPVEVEPEIEPRVPAKVEPELEKPPGIVEVDIVEPIAIEDITEFKQVQAEARHRAEENVLLRQKAELGKAEAAERKAAAEMLKREEVPIYAAMDEAVKHGGLNRDVLLKEFLEEDVNALSRKRPGLVRKDGPVRIDLLGERHGFEREIFSIMLETPTKKQFIERAGEQFREAFPAEVEPAVDELIQERRWLVDKKTGKILTKSDLPSGDEWQANVDVKDFVKFLDNEVIDIHTHPDNSFPSDGDWGVLGWSHVKEIQVILANKEVITLEKPQDFKYNPRQLRDMWARHEDDIFSSGLSKDLSAEEIIFEINKRMAKETGVTISEKPVPPEVLAELAKEFPTAKIRLDEGMILEEEINIVNQIMSARRPKAATGLKGKIRELTGQVRVEEKTITESEALRAAFKKAAQSARTAFREGNKGGLVTERARMRKIFNNYKEVVKRSREVDATIKEIKATRKRLKRGNKNLAIEFQKLLDQAFKGVDLSKGKFANLEKVAKGLKVAIDEFTDTLAIPPERFDEIKRLADISGKEFTSADVKSLKDTLKELNLAGKIRAKMDMKYDEILRNQALKKLYPSTHPIDPKKSEKSITSKKLTNFDTIRAGTWWAYIQTLHTPRVTQIADGYKHGENTRLLRTLADGETEAKILTRDRTVRFYERLVEMDITPQELEDLSNVPGGKMAQRINANLVNDRPNSESQVKELLEKYGMKEVPVLNDREKQILNILRESVGAKTAEVKATFEEVKNEIFYDEENYWPFKYEQEFGVEPGDAIKHDRHRKSRTEQGFTVRRLKGVKQAPRDDLLNILEEAINEQEWFIALEPRLENLRSLLFTEEYRAVAGETLFNWWKNQTDIVARRGWSANANFNEGTALLRQFRHNLNVAILGYKLSSIVMQPFAVFDAMAYMQAKFGTAVAAEVLGEVMKAWVLPGYAKEIIDKSPALQLRAGGELAIEETLQKIGRGKSTWDKFQLESLTLLRKADLRTAAGAESAFLKIFERLGVEEPLKEAEFIMNMTQGSADTVYRPQILASGEIARTGFTFQTFFLGRWGIIAHDIITTGLLKSSDWKKKYNAALALAIFMAAGLAEDEIREFIYEFTTGKELPEQSMIRRLLLYLPTQIPLLGHVLERGDFSVPIISVVEKLVRGPVQIVTGKDDEAKLRGVLKTAEGVASLILGIPGTAQTFDLIERMVLED